MELTFRYLGQQFPNFQPASIFTTLNTVRLHARFVEVVMRNTVIVFFFLQTLSSLRFLFVCIKDGCFEIQRVNKYILINVV